MARGDQSDFLWRLGQMLPPWFGELAEAPVLSGVLAGLAWVHAQTWGWTTYVRAQGRISTASGANLDDIAFDFFGYVLARNAGEIDAHFAARIKAALLQPKATRAALLSAVEAATGYPGKLVEPWNAFDCGGYASLTDPGGGGGTGYASSTTGAAGGGANGSLVLPYQAFLVAYRPPIVPPAGVTGYGSLITTTGCGPGGYGTLADPTGNTGSIEFASEAGVQATPDADVYAAISAVLPIGTVLWTQLVDQPPNLGAEIDVNFVLDASAID